ncbi:MAG TPA: hypothetical protein VF101_19040 [Gaiellaceae bacterium]
MRPEPPAAVPARRRSLRIGAVVALALAAAFVAWLVVRGDDSGSSTTTTASSPATTATQGPKTKPLLEAASVPTLKTVAALVGHPIYWAGAKSGTTYELTRTTDGRIYVRYLPPGVKVGDKHADYLIVATYPVRDAYRAVQTASKENGAEAFRIKNGGRAVLNKRAPTNVYFAYPRSNYQIEVYDPHPGRARNLVASGKIRPIR